MIIKSSAYLYYFVFGKTPFRIYEGQKKEKWRLTHSLVSPSPACPLILSELAFCLRCMLFMGKSCRASALPGKVQVMRGEAT